MDHLHSIIISPTVENLVMTFLHSLWQGAMIAGVLWCLLQTLKHKPDIRYTMSMLALVALMVVMFFTYAALEQGFIRHGPPIAHTSPLTTNQDSTSYTVPAPSTDAQISAVQTTPRRYSWSAESHNPSDIITAVTANAAASPQSVGWQGYVFVLWLGGVCLMLGRMFVMIYGAFRLRSTCNSNTDKRIGEQFTHLKGLLSVVGKVALGFSTKVVVPCTIGCIRPMIILPAAVIGMNAQDIETILLHELAHVKRLDWLVNIIQMLLESILFFNPAAWWISHQIRIEREAACDGYVVTHTQRPVQYAQLLLRFAAASSHPVNAVALALNGSTESPDKSGTSLSERVRRLIVPGYRPNVHPGIVPVLLTLVALVFCGVGAYKTSSATLRYFGRHMTPEQRAETVLALKEEYHPKQGQQADLPKDQWIHLKGRVVTGDGLPLPTRTYRYRGKDRVRVDADLMTQTGNSSARQSIGEDGTFEFTLRQSHFTVSIACKGYATQHVAMEYDPGANIEDLEITLSKGYAASIRFVDQESQPVPAVKVTGGYPAPPKYGSYIHSIKKTSGEDGVIRFDNAGDALMSLTCQAPGYAKASKSKIHLAENEVREWVLEPATLSKIQITDKQTRQPLDDAPVYVTGKEFHSSFGGKQGETRTDASGQAVLDSLIPGEPYLIMIHPAGMQRQYFSITPGESIQAEFEPIRPIKGRIVGDLSRLSRDDRGPYLQQTNTYHESGNTSFSNSGRRTFVDVINDQEAVFQVDDYYGQKVTLHAADQAYTVDVDGADDLENIVFNLSPQEISTGGTRKVSFTFNGIDNNPIRPDSQFKLLYQARGSHYTKPHSIEIVDGKAETYLYLPVNLHWEPLPGTNFYFKKGHENLDQDRDYHFEISCQPAGSVFGVVNVPREFRYEYVYMRIEFLNRGELFEQYGFLPDNDFNMSSQAQTKFMFGPLPLGGRYRVTFSCRNMFIISDEIQLTEQQPLCELTLPWPQETVTLRGRILDQAGAPAANLKYNISVKTEQHSRSFATQATDEKGWFECANINTDKNIDYTITLKPDMAPSFEYALNKTETPVTLSLKKAVMLRGVLKNHAGQIQSNAEFHLSPKRRGQRNQGYCNQQIKTDGQGRFRAYLGDTDYTYYSRRRLKTYDDGRVSYTGESVPIRPGKDQNVTVVIDPPHH